MSSQRQLLAEGAAKRADMVKVRIDHIHVEPGFNVQENADDFQARVDGMVLHLKAGGRLPPIETRDRHEGGVYVVDGHARLKAYALAHEQNVPVADPKDGFVYLLTIPFVGNDADRIVRLVTSAEGRRLTPMQQAEVYKRLQAFDWSPAEIAAKVSKTPQYVSQILTLANANMDVQMMVKAGEVSATEAVKVVKQVKEKAGAVLKERLKVAKEAGKKKVTASTGKVKGKAALRDVNGVQCDDSAILDFLVQHGTLRITDSGVELKFSAPQSVRDQSDLRVIAQAAMQEKSSLDEEPSQPNDLEQQEKVAA